MVVFSDVWAHLLVQVGSGVTMLCASYTQSFAQATVLFGLQNRPRVSLKAASESGFAQNLAQSLAQSPDLARINLDTSFARNKIDRIHFL